MEATYERANSKAGICTLRKHTDCRMGSERRILSVVCMTQTKLGVTMLRDLLQKRISFGHRDARGRVVTHPYRRCNEGHSSSPTRGLVCLWVAVGEGDDRTR